jgi:hypothetical protein
MSLRNSGPHALLLVALLLVAEISFAAGAPALDVTVLDAKTIVVRGKAFRDERLLVSADMDVPHASVACYTDFTRVALARNGAFETTINPAKCDFRCSRDRSGYLVSVEGLGGTTLAQARFACAPARTRRRR